MQNDGKLNAEMTGDITNDTKQKSYENECRDIGIRSGRKKKLTYGQMCQLHTTLKGRCLPGSNAYA